MNKKKPNQKIITLFDLHQDLLNCAKPKCVNEINELYKKTKELVLKFDAINKYYKEGKITKTQKSKYIDKVYNDYNNSNEQYDIYKCRLNNCYKETAKYLDYIVNDIKYNKISKYTLDDYINILNAQHEYNRKKTVINTHMNKLLNCYKKNCNKEFNDLLKINKLNALKIDELENNLKNNVITEKQYKENVSKIFNEFINTKEYIEFKKCHNNNCNKLIQKYLKILNKELNYQFDDKAKYTIDDFIKILNIRY